MPPLAEVLGESPAIQAVRDTVGRLLARGAEGAPAADDPDPGRDRDGEGTAGRRLGARGAEAHALCLAGDVALASGAEDAEGYYREALALATELGMRPLVAHCHLGLGALAGRMGDSKKACEALSTAAGMYREMGMIYWLEKAEAGLERIG